MMATGYTHPIIEKDITFPQYARLCARAFGALVSMRDEPLEAPLPEKFEPSDYHLKELDGAKENLARLQALDPAGQAAYGEALKATEIERYTKQIEEEKASNARLDAMLAQVEAWTPPSPDHQGLKRFMREQIEMTRTKDNYWGELLTQTQSRSPEDFFTGAVAKAERDVQYHTQGHADEVNLTTKRNAWLQQLRDSLTD